MTEAWSLKSGRLTLSEGDSAMGYRLLLDQVAQDERPLELHRCRPPRSPFSACPSPCPAFRSNCRRAPGGDAEGAVRTALCVEFVAGRLHVFLPPLARLEHFLELISALEATAKAQRVPLVLEGYEPPSDNRLINFRVTPDPGVLEVNIHPSADWAGPESHRGRPV